MERTYYRRHLPHWHPPGAALFLTMRLAGSLPTAVAQRLQADLLLAREQAGDDAEALRVVSRQHFGRFDALLDAVAPTSPRWLAEFNVARLVLESLQWIARRGDFTLLAACAMPNHLHVVVVLPLEPVRLLEQTLRDFKQYTAVHANRLLIRTGAFWQHETYDHVVRDSGDGVDLTRVINYVLYNPVKAGLCTDWSEWPGTWCVPL